MKNNKGITLVILIVTVIILFILAAIGIKIIDTNIFERSSNKVNTINDKTREDELKKNVIEQRWDDEPGVSVKSPTGT